MCPLPCWDQFMSAAFISPPEPHPRGEGPSAGELWYAASRARPLVDDDVRGLVHIEPRHGRLRAEGLPDLQLLVAELLVVLVGDDVRLGGAPHRLDVLPQHAVALVVEDRVARHLVEVDPRVGLGVRVDPRQHARHMAGPELPLHAQGGRPGHAPRQLRVEGRAVGEDPDEPQQRRQHEQGEHGGLDRPGGQGGTPRPEPLEQGGAAAHHRGPRQEAQERHGGNPVLHPAEVRHLGVADDEDGGDRVDGHQGLGGGWPLHPGPRAGGQAQQAAAHHREPARHHGDEEARGHRERRLHQHVFEGEGRCPEELAQVEPRVVLVPGVEGQVPGRPFHRVVPEVGPVQVEEHRAEHRQGGDGQQRPGGGRAGAVQPQEHPGCPRAQRPEEQHVRAQEEELPLEPLGPQRHEEQPVEQRHRREQPHEAPEPLARRRQPRALLPRAPEREGGDDEGQEERVVLGGERQSENHPAPEAPAPVLQGPPEGVDHQQPHRHHGDVEAGQLRVEGMAGNEQEGEGGEESRRAAVEGAAQQEQERGDRRRHGERRQADGGRGPQPPQPLVEEQLGQPEELLHEHRVLVVDVVRPDDGRVRERRGGVAEEQPEPVRVALRGGEVDALVPHEAHRALGEQQGHEGQQPQGPGQAPLVPRGSPSQHHDPPAVGPRANTSRHTCRLSALVAWVQTFTVRGSPGGRVRSARCTPTRPGGSAISSSRSLLWASSTPMSVVLREGDLRTANSVRMPPSSRSPVPPGTPSNSATSLPAPPGGCIHRQRRGSYRSSCHSGAI
ncbi:conserved hypothetical protein [Stigmatella aurantiaca DW4/3-1]|uniref:Uncharacterized protein n=1 Tax=Stigmatella aurantiaca (strain DW4/3-1) TaxID=378806 RepID=Q09BK6_STIAD|nr:conserved hypothetical protein [Stigmatella aurantiaca DW4/3-1]